MLEFNNAQTSFFIKASLPAHFCCLSFPKTFHRARKNSIDLFNDALMQSVIGVEQFSNERSFQINLTNDWSIIFKMHGNRSNVLLSQGNRITSIFKRELTSDNDLDIGSLHRSIPIHEPTTLEEAKSSYFTWSKSMWEYLEHAMKEHPERNFISVFYDVMQKLENPVYYLVNHHHVVHFSLLNYGVVDEVHSDPITALNSFFLKYSSSLAFKQEKDHLLKRIETKMQGGKTYLQKNEQKLHEIQNDEHYQQWADLVMANLHVITAGASAIVLPGFYDNRQITIKLNPELSPQKNAAVFYRKAKNKQLEIDQLSKAIHQKKKELEGLTLLHGQIQAAQDLKSLHATGVTLGPAKVTNQQAVSLPYHEFIFKGYKIWVGRNAISNDILTLKLAYKEDLWLHAKDVSGSHVIIKHQAGKNFPKDVITFAAQLAAFNSKRKSESLCPVTVTPKKFVRKRKGDPAGMVVVEREEVIMVEPKPA